MTPGPASVTVEIAGIPNCRAATRACSVHPMRLVNAPQISGYITSYSQIPKISDSCSFRWISHAFLMSFHVISAPWHLAFPPRHKGQEGIVEDDARRGHHLVEGFQQFGQYTPSRSSTEIAGPFDNLCYVCGLSLSEAINVYNICMCVCDMFWKNIVAQEWGHHWCAAALNSTSLIKDICKFVPNWKKFLLISKMIPGD